MITRVEGTPGMSVTIDIERTAGGLIWATCVTCGTRSTTLTTSGMAHAFAGTHRCRPEVAAR